MDFVARAGSVIQKANRLSGLLLILNFVLVILWMNTLSTNSTLNKEYRLLRDQAQVYIVPGATADMYSPGKGEMLLSSFVDHVTQSLNTYTYKSLEKQYREINHFFTPEMLVLANNHYATLIQQAQQDERSSLYVPNKSSLKASRIRNKQGKATKLLQVTLNGTIQYILGGSVIETAPIKISLKLKETNISITNPFGYQLAYYKERIISSQPKKEEVK